jgi:hypothetical protein
MNIRGEVETAEFGDRRLTARLVRIAEQLAKAPHQSFPKAARSDAALEATYRFFGNESVTPAAILQPHVRATAARCAGAGAVFVAHDSIELRFTTERHDVGRLSWDDTHGCIGHFALAVAANTRAPLGILGIETVFRERGTRVSYRRGRRLEEKESRRWLSLVERVDSEIPDVPAAIHVMDREADAYELLAALCAGNRRFIIRLQIDRAADTTMGRGRISEVMKRRRTLLTREVTLSARKPNRADPPNRARRHPYRRTRAATLAVTAASVTIRRPRHGRAHTPAALRLSSRSPGARGGVPSHSAQDCCVRGRRPCSATGASHSS